MVFDNLRKRSNKKNFLTSNLPISPERRREKLRSSQQAGDAGFGLLHEDDVFQTGSYTSKSSRQTYGGSILENDNNEKSMLGRKPSAPVRTKSGFWGFGRNPPSATEDGQSFNPSSKASSKQRSKKPPPPLRNGQESFNIEPSQRFYDDEEDQFLFEALNINTKSSSHHRPLRRKSEVESNFSEDHSDSTLSTNGPQQHHDSRFTPQTPPPSTPNKGRSNNIMALAHHGDWGNPQYDDKLIKSPDRTTRHLNVMRQLAAPADSSSSSESDDAGTYVSGATPVDNPELLDFSTDDDDSIESIVICHTDDDAMIQRKVSRMSSGQLRRWDGFQDQVTILVKSAMPDAVDDVPKLMTQFAGREAELIQTLQNIASRSPRQRMNRNVIHKSKAIQGTRTVSALPMDAIAKIAAANVLDDNMQAVKPEFVVDENDLASPNESSASTNQDEEQSYYSEDEESSEESSFDENDDDLSSYDEEDSSSEDDHVSSGMESGMDDYSDDDMVGVAEGTVASSFWDGFE